MNVGILGSGDVAKALAAGFLGRGDSVMLGTRDASKLASWRSSAGVNARVGSFAEAALFGDVVVVATLGTAAEEAIASAGASSFDGKVVIDATNPLDYGGDRVELAFGFSDSLGERVQRAIPGAKVVKAFNTVGNQHMIKPQFPGGPPTMFIAGNDSSAKGVVTGILRDFGWDSADLGDIAASRYLEPMCMAWVRYGVNAGSWDHAFKLLRR